MIQSPFATSKFELSEPGIRAGWCCNHHSENNPSRSLQAGHYSLVERLLYAGKPNILATRWMALLFPPCRRHRDALKCEARADPNGAVQSMQTPVLGPKFRSVCRFNDPHSWAHNWPEKISNSPKKDMERNWNRNWKRAVYPYIHENSSHQWNNFWLPGCFRSSSWPWLSCIRASRLAA